MLYAFEVRYQILYLLAHLLSFIALWIPMLRPDPCVFASGEVKVYMFEGLGLEHVADHLSASNKCGVCPAMGMLCTPLVDHLPGGVTCRTSQPLVLVTPKPRLYP